MDVDAGAAEQRIVIDQGYVWGDLCRMGGRIKKIAKKLKICSVKICYSKLQNYEDV